MLNDLDNVSDFIFYNGFDGNLKIEVIVGDETVWLNQKNLSDLFDIDRSVITKHLQNIYSEGELDETATCAKIAQVQMEGNREVKRQIEYYNLDVIIAVGYRANSYQATQFRIWATRVLKEYLLKGFALDDERLKQGKKLFGKDYFEELLTRIREIRASERRFYQKITDIYAQCSIDYNPNSPITQSFFATVQNKLEYAITHHTAPEIIKLRASSQKPNMGLTSWKNEKIGGKILKYDVSIAKNYLNEKEIGELNSVVNMYLDYAELQAKRNIPMNMADWVGKLDAFLKFNEYEVLKDAGTISHTVAKAFAEKEYKKFRIIQDKAFESDFDRFVKRVKSSEPGNLSKEESEELQKAMGDFDTLVKKMLSVPPPPK